MVEEFNENVVKISSKHTVKHSESKNMKPKIPSDRMALIRRKKRLNSKINCLKYLGFLRCQKRKPNPP